MARKHTPEELEKIRTAARRRMQDPAQRKQLSDRQKAFHARRREQEEQLLQTVEQLQDAVAQL